MKYYSNKFIAVFNSSQSNFRLAKAKYIKKFGKANFEKYIKPYIDEGIMSIFTAKPNRYTKTYVMILAAVSDESAYRRKMHWNSIAMSKYKGPDKKYIPKMRKDVTADEYQRFHTLYMWLKERKLGPKIIKITEFDTFYSIDILCNKSRKSARLSQNQLFRLGFNSVSYKHTEKLKVGINIKKRKSDMTICSQ